MPFLASTYSLSKYFIVLVWLPVNEDEILEAVEGIWCNR